VLQVVAIDRSNDDIPQAHRLRSAGHALRLVPVNRRGTALGHRAERATPRTLVAQNHERSGAVFPALAQVGTAGALADGVKPEPAHGALELVIVVTGRRAHLQPRRPGRGAQLSLDLHQLSSHKLILLRRDLSSNRRNPSLLTAGQPYRSHRINFLLR